MTVLIELFIAFLKIGLLSIGGGYAAMPLIQSETLVSHNWLTLTEFNNLVTISEMTPGSIAINGATFVGVKVAGITGAIVATIAVIVPSLILLSLISFIYYRYRKMPFVQNILLALRPAVVALILGVCISLFQTSIINEDIIKSLIYFTLFILSFIALRKYKKSPILIMGLCGLSYMLINLIFLI